MSHNAGAVGSTGAAAHVSPEADAAWRLRMWWIVAAAEFERSRIHLDAQRQLQILAAAVLIVAESAAQTWSPAVATLDSLMLLPMMLPLVQL